MKAILSLTLSSLLAYGLMLILPVVLICWLIKHEADRRADAKPLRCDGGEGQTPCDLDAWTDDVIEQVLRNCR